MIPSALLNSLYTVGSLKNTDGGVEFAIKNRLADAEVVGFFGIAIDGQPVAMDRVRLDLEDGRGLAPFEVSAANPIPFPLRSTVKVHASAQSGRLTRHKIEIAFDTRPFGKLKLRVEDAAAEDGAGSRSIPRAAGDDDYSPEIVGRRRALIEKETGVALKHIVHHSLDPHAAKGNCENFVGVAQVPIGIAGPLHVCGEHAQGDFLIPLATTEGTLVASYNRGIKALNLCGGVKVTVVDDAMQRAPVFIFQDARAGRDFARWVQANLAPIRKEAEATSSVAKLLYIDAYLASKFTYLRFNFSTGDAAGQNMVGRATLAACQWILDHYAGIVDFYLESNFATDKKASDINRLRTRGKRVTAEAVIRREVLIQRLRVEPEKLIYHYGVANVGALLSGANNNGGHSANGIAAMFIATGQDAANVAESSAAILYTELTKQGDQYISLTIPSLIVATYGGGTGLATQRECLEMLQCYGRDKVNRLAEIVGGVALAGEISLGAAISASDWVSAHEKHGRNR
jgi:hydroxymethylglutaryl-CoA reductase (NADPH)